MKFSKILSQKEKREIENKLNQQFGIEKIKGILVRKGQEKIFLFQGEFNEKELDKLEKNVIIERIGIYLLKIEREEIRLSIEGTQLLKGQITKNIFELNEEQVEKWMMGQELHIQTGKKGFLIMKHKNDFLGTGKASENKIGNFIPKSRRLKSKDII